jgi:uncharacterized protein YciI
LYIEWSIEKGFPVFRKGMFMSQRIVVYYAVTLEWGEGRDARYSMRQQEKWDEHAACMDALVDDGFIILGGPLDDAEKVLLVINAESKPAIEARLADDPWIQMEIRRIANVERWEILLDARRERATSRVQSSLCITWEEPKVHRRYTDTYREAKDT